MAGFGSDGLYETNETKDAAGGEACREGASLVALPETWESQAGWVSSPRVKDKELAAHLREAWKLIAPEKLHDLLQRHT